MKLTAKTVAAAIFAATLMVSLAALGQAASTTPSSSQYQYGPGGHQYGPAGDQYGKKIVICHKGKTIMVSRHAFKGHKRHHDALGPCADHRRKHGKHEGKGHEAKGHEAKSHEGSTSVVSSERKAHGGDDHDGHDGHGGDKEKHR